MRHVRKRINRAAINNRPKAQDKSPTSATRHIFTAITRPRQIKPRAQGQAQLHESGFPHFNERGDDLDLSLARAGFYDLAERVVVRWTAIRISRTILLYSANVNRLCAQYLGPAYCCRQEMCVAEGNVSDGDPASANSLGCSRFRDLNIPVRQRRPPYDTKRFILKHQACLDFQGVADALKRAALPLLGALPIPDVKRARVRISRPESHPH